MKFLNFHMRKCNSISPPVNPHLQWSSFSCNPGGALTKNHTCWPFGVVPGGGGGGGALGCHLLALGITGRILSLLIKHICL